MRGTLCAVNEPARRLATYQDVLDSPPHVVAEIVNGVLYQTPRPATRHVAAASALGEELGPPFKRGRGGPGGWMLLDEPEVHLGPHVLVPDLGGWRRERMPELPDAPYIELVPDWVCEVASPSTRRLDRGEKLPIYGEQGVRHVWIVEPQDQLVEVLELDGATYRIVQTASGDQQARLRPFDAIEIELAVLWAR